MKLNIQNMNIYKYILFLMFTIFFVVLIFGCTVNHKEKDSTTPIPGDNGTITISNVTTVSLTLTWVEATDNVTSQENLQYKVVQSQSDNIDSVINAEENGTVIKDWTSNIAILSVTGLTSDTTYYFNVIVKDEAGNKAAYTMVSQTTNTGNRIIVNVTYSDSSLDGKNVYVKSFTDGGDIPDDVVETQVGVLSGDSASIILDNNGAGYPDGTYEIRAHIDVNDNGLSAEENIDYITLGKVTVNGASSDVTLSGPWGTYSGFSVYNSSPPTDTDGKTMYIIVVSQGNYWGNYSYAKNTFLLPGAVIGMDLWGPFGTYDLYACIDMNDNMDVTGAPDSGDYVYSHLNIDWSSDSFPNETISSWSTY